MEFGNQIFIQSEIELAYLIIYFLISLENFVSKKDHETGIY